MRIIQTTHKSTYKNRGCEKISLGAIGHCHLIGSCRSRGGVDGKLNGLADS